MRALGWLAECFEYPREGFGERIAAVRARIQQSGAAVAGHLDALAEMAGARPLAECEELYVRTFDMNAERALEVGWQVFGEQYARGAFLVRLRELMRDHGVEESAELPDHLTNVLRLLPRLPESEARLLVDSALLPALARITSALDEPGNPYAGVLAAVRKLVSESAEPAVEDVAPQGAAS